MYYVRLVGMVADGGSRSFLPHRRWNSFPSRREEGGRGGGVRTARDSREKQIPSRWNSAETEAFLVYLVGVKEVGGGARPPPPHVLSLAPFIPLGGPLD